MQLSTQDLNQLDEEELLNLSEEELRRLSKKLLTDLKEARERLNQNSHNPRKISCSRFLAQALDSTALPKNIRLTYG